MTIQEQITEDLHISMKKHNTTETSLLRVILGEFLRVEKLPADKKVTDAEAIKVIKKMTQCSKECNNFEELLILERYLPKELSEQELEIEIAKARISGYTTMPNIMKYLKVNCSNYSGKMAFEIIKKLNL